MGIKTGGLKLARPPFLASNIVSSKLERSLAGSSLFAIENAANERWRIFGFSVHMWIAQRAAAADRTVLTAQTYLDDDINFVVFADFSVSVLGASGSTESQGMQTPWITLPDSGLVLPKFGFLQHHFVVTLNDGTTAQNIRAGSVLMMQGVKEIVP